MKKQKETRSKIAPILVAVIVCICTAVGFGAVEYLQGGLIKTPVSEAVDDPSILYRVLEIEPCWDYFYDEDPDAESFKVALAKALHCAASQISFKYVSTAEFNGMNEDLVASYDIIVMGTRTGTMNTVNGSTVYNDRELDGYIYLAYGDLVKYDDRMAGMLPYDYYTCIDDYVNGVYSNGSFHSLNQRVSNGTMYIDTTADTDTTNWKDKWYIYNMNNDAVWTPAMQNYFSGQYYILRSINSTSWSNVIEYYDDPLGNARFTGNDITKKKMNELLDFVSTGRPIVLSSKLYTCVSDNLASEDSNKAAYPTSNVYSLLTSINGMDNVVDLGNIEAELAAAVHRPVLEIVDYSMTYQNASNEWVAAPNVSYTSGLVSDSCIIYNVNQFRYTVDFNATIGKSYYVKLIVDKDTDGRFDSEASVDDFNEVYYAKILVADEAQEHVQLDINLANNYNGMFGWQILVEELDSARNPIDRVSVEGHTVVKGETKRVKVLQLMPGTNDNDALNMATSSVFTQQMSSASGKIGYSVTVDTMKVGEFESKFISNPYTNDVSYKTESDYLNANGYNMLVIGFADSYRKEDISDDYGALSCVLDYIENGNSVLFSHDTMQFQPSGNMGIAFASTEWRGSAQKLNLKLTSGWNERAGVMMTLGMRDLVGMDRYSVTTIPSYTDATVLEAANVPKDKDGNYITEIQGFSDFILLWLNIHSNYVADTRMNTTIHTLVPNKNVIGHTGWANVRTKRVEEINEGQITMYPYDVTTTGFLDVGLTHSQYFQLDLEDDDIVVWYTLTDDSNGKGKLYSATKRDAANNYYIYSKGNVTYTGAGHITGEDGTSRKIDGISEVRLFVNTVIRAASAGNFVPTVKAVNGYSTRNAGTYVVSPKAYDTEYLVQFEAYDEDLATIEVIKDSYPEAQWKEHIGRFDSGAIYWVDEATGTSKLLKTYNRTNSADYLLNGETTDFVIYNPLDKGYTEAQINANSLLKNMYDCYMYYDEKGKIELRVDATDYYGETGSCIIQVIEQELFDLD